MYSGIRSTLSITFTEPLSVVRDSDQAAAENDLKKEKPKREKNKSKKRKYKWAADQWGECSHPCGDGQ